MTVSLERAPRRRTLRPQRTGAEDDRWPLARLFAVGVATAAVVAVIVVALGGFALWRLSEARSALLDVGGPSTLAAERLSVALLDQETGVRGFELSGRAEFLDPYRSGLEAEQRNIAILRELSGDASRRPILEAVDVVEAAAVQWRTTYAEPLLDPQAVPPPPDQGRELFERVRTELRTLTTEIGTQQQGLRAGLNAAAAFLFWVGLAIVVVLASFLVLAGIGLRRYVLTPVAFLAEEVRQVVSGDVQREVRADGPREIVQLGEDVDAMRYHILRDLADAQAVNQRLDEQARDLERSNRDLEQFAYVASHDLQEPLRKVSSFCQLLQRRYGGQLDERADQYIEFAVDGAQRMQRLINDLLAFSRVGRTTEAFEAVDLTELAATAAAQLEGIREQVDGEFVLDDLPTVRGDRGLLLQLLVNLMGNGLKFHRDGVPPVVRVHAERSTDHWEITVADNGIGIEPEYAEKVFVIFQRLHGRDRYTGTGIGLALAKKIVEFHGGRIGLVTRTPALAAGPAAGAGTPVAEPGATIRFTLPAAAGDTTEAP